MTDLFRYPSFDTFRFLDKVLFKNEDNFFTDGFFKIEPDIFKGDILRLRTHFSKEVYKNHSLEDVKLSLCDKARIIKKRGSFSCQTGKECVFKFGGTPFRMDLTFQGKKILSSSPGIVGYNGPRTAFAFAMEKDQPFWGFGEKTGRLNKHGASMKMWNVDVIPDHGAHARQKDYDPSYVSIPFFITKTGGVYVGFYLHNPCETFFDMGRSDPGIFFFGSYLGACDLYIIPGPSLNDVLRKFHDMTGRPEMPSLWSLGHHQCRWSYRSVEEALAVVRNYEKNKIPLGCLWLDIDYMDGYRVFTWNKKTFGARKKFLDELHQKGVKLVTIIDPGVKRDEKYSVYQEGRKKDLFCKTHNGLEYIGYVWPGKTVFPDFSLKAAQSWWAEKIAKFVSIGVDGIWIDMNDPSTGSAERSDMLFRHGTAEHQYYHNQYGTLMAQATRKGLHRQNPNSRPFILTRSASAGIQKYSAVWTGDNFSNWEHLQMTIPESVNLSLSGVSFNGPDIGGFMGNTTPQLITRWYEAGFLFPFFRNHTEIGSSSQEPYRFEKRYMNIMKKFINLHYKFLPYIYDQFFRHRVHSEPVLRPIFYEFDKKEFYGLDDQLMVGPYILHAPILSENNERTVTLPMGQWFDYFENKWVKGGRKFTVKCGLEDTKLYFRDGSMIPLLKDNDFSDLEARDHVHTEFHVYMHDETDFTCYHYEDDGATSSYLEGVYDLYGVRVKKIGQKMNINVKSINRRYRKESREIIFHVHSPGGIRKMNIKI